MTEVFVVKLYTSRGPGGSAIFSTLEDAERLVLRLGSQLSFVEKHRDRLRPHELRHIDSETNESFFFSHLTLHTSVEIKKKILH